MSKKLDELIWILTKDMKIGEKLTLEFTLTKQRNPGFFERDVLAAFKVEGKKQPVR